MTQIFVVFIALEKTSKASMMGKNIKKMSGHFSFFPILRLNIAQSLHTRHASCVEFDCLSNATIINAFRQQLFLLNAKTLFPKWDMCSRQTLRLFGL
jgi:hypothetical protein